MPIDKVTLDTIRSNHPVFKMLTLDSELLTDADIEQLCEALKTNTVTKELFLLDNCIGDEGASLLAKKELFSLVLSYNGIGDIGAKALATSTTLTELSIGNNCIGDDGVIALADNQNIATLCLKYNQWGDKGARALAQSTTLTTLGRKGVELSEDSQLAIKSMLTRNRAEADKLYNACMLENLEEVKILLNSGVKPYGGYFGKLNDARNTLLHTVVTTKNTELLALVLKYGAGCERHNANKALKTPENFAEIMRWKEGVALLNGESLVDDSVQLPTISVEVHNTTFSSSLKSKFSWFFKRGDVNSESNENKVKENNKVRSKYVNPI